jgi:hypothetical protein
MKISTYLLAFAFLTHLTSSCQKKESSSVEKSEASTTVELLSHTQGKFDVAETVTIDMAQESFAIGGKSFKVKARWDDAEVKRETLNDNPEEAHAVELSWMAKEKAKTENRKDELLWIFPTGSEENAAPQLSGTLIQPRLLPPGSRIVTKNDLEKSLTSAVQFEWKNKRYDIPELGQEVFDGWKVTGLRIFKHALLNDDGTIAESDDTGFSNRAVEITIEAKDGSKERHVSFIDHPQLTAGIHPTLLPVTRMSGDLASLSRLIVCGSLKAPVTKSLLVMSPNTSGESITTWLWAKGEKAPTSSRIEKFPTTLTLGDEKVIVTRHWAKARRQIKWQQREGADEKDKKPALLIETGGHFHAKQFVLIRGEVTPCSVMDEMILLRYR